MQQPTPLRTPLKRARGLGSAHAGTHHFWVQRVSAAALVPLSLWFMVNLVARLMGADRSMVAGWLKAPFTALMLSGLIIAGLTHARLGVQVIIEDYVAGETRKILLLLFLNAVVLVLGAMALLAIARLHFFGA